MGMKGGSLSESSPQRLCWEGWLVVAFTPPAYRTWRPYATCASPQRLCWGEGGGAVRRATAIRERAGEGG